MKKRILQLIPSFHSGGSERQAVTLTRMLDDDASYDVSAATLNKEGVLLPQFLNSFQGELPEFKLTSFYDRNFVFQVRRFATLLKERGVDVLHTHDFYSNVFGMAAATLAGTPVRIASKRETGGLRSRAQDLVEKIAFGRADAVLVNSKAVRDHLSGRGIPSEKIHLVYNGIDVEVFETASANYPDQLSLAAPKVRLITLVANLRHGVKNVPMFLRTARRVAAVHEDVHFVIAGEGELGPSLKNLAAELRLSDRVHFIGRCENVPSLLKASYACVLTSTAEGFSNSLIEYMAAGKPVVATNVGGAAEAIDDPTTGYLVESDDDEAMARRLIELLDDENKARRMGDAGKAVALERFSLTSQISKLRSLYEQLLAN